MAKLYLFGIGGTGSRVIKSLAMLLSAGVDFNGYELVPIIIDPDSANGDVTRTVEILKAYQHIHERINKEKTPDSSFFSTPISGISQNFRLEIKGSHNEEFREYIGYSELSDNNKALISMLFSEDNLRADMEVGFKGNPNIGSVVLNQFSESEDFVKFASDFSTGDRIFIISSIFGGTGAAGFPLLLKNIKNADHTLPTWALLKEAPIGAISILPYFGVWPDPKSKIDKATFISKTKAALTYYNKNVSGNNSLNALYYIGDEVNKDYENHEGSTFQKNDAHFIELAAALAIVDFVATDDSYLQNVNGRATAPLYKEYGVINDAETMTFGDLGKGTQMRLREALTKFTLFNMYTENHIHSALDLPWATGSVKIDRQFLGQPFFNTYIRTINKHFWEWLTELKRNKRSFAPFDLKVGYNNLFELVADSKPKKGLFERGSNYSRLDYLLSKVEPKIKAKDQDTFFIELFDKALENATKEKFGT
ncbi:hypothetical protein [Albibacterium profundi]|uniref:Tubulin/FtsZ GTPase domain-containing protein n=1 Tax=Albibacterium profundi TaxID=3134906 RepID=A0ABV5CA07_9SPHI